MVRAYLIKEKQSGVEKALGFLTNDPDIRRPEHQIFIPGKIVIGNYKCVVPGNFRLSDGGLYIIEDPQHLAAIKVGVQKRILETVMNLDLPTEDVERIVKQANNYQQAREKIKETTHSISEFNYSR